MNIFSTITAKTMKQNRTRTIVTVIGVILSTAMITAVTTFGTSFQKFLVDYSLSKDGDWHLEASGITGAKADKLAGQEEVESAVEVKILGFALFDPVRERSPKIPYLYVRSLSEEARKALPMELSEGRMPENAGEIVVPNFLLANEAEGEKTKVGDTLTLEIGERSYTGERLGQGVEYMGEDYEESETFTPKMTRTFQVVGIYESWPDVSFWGPGYDVFTGPTDEETEYLDLFLKMVKPREVYRFAEENLTDSGEVYQFNSSLLRWLGVTDNSNLTMVLGGLMAILVVVIMVGSITLIYNAFSISLRERTVQFGLLSSMGATKRQLRSSMRYEAFFVSAVGIPLGILAGVGGIGVTLHYIGGALTNWIHGTEIGIPLYVPWWAVLVAAVTAFATVMISVWIPSRRIRKISPMEAIRASQDIRVRAKEVKTGKWTQRLFGIEGMMAQKNYKRDRRKYRATVVSLTMSIVLFTTAALFNMYLVATGSFVLEAPEMDLEYTIYVDARKVQDEADDVIGRTEGVTSFYRYNMTRLDLLIPEKECAESEALQMFSQDAPEANEGKIPVMATVLVLGDAEFEQFAKEQGVNVGAYGKSEHLPLLYLNQAKKFNTETERYEKASIFPEEMERLLDSGYMDYDAARDVSEFVEGERVELRDAVKGLPKEMAAYEERIVLLTSESLFEKFAGVFEGGELNARFSIQCENAAETFEKLETRLEESGLDDVGYLQNWTEQYESDRNTMAAVKVLTYGFIILISLIAVANVFNTISTNLMLRRKEFAMLKSMGMSPKGFRRMMNYECLIYGVRAIIYGVIFTILISLGIRRTIGAGADVEFIIPWSYLAVAVVGVFAVVFLTMLYTMRAIKKNNIVEELKMN